MFVGTPCDAGVRHGDIRHSREIFFFNLIFSKQLRKPTPCVDVLCQLPDYDIMNGSDVKHSCHPCSVFQTNSPANKQLTIYDNCREKSTNRRPKSLRGKAI